MDIPRPDVAAKRRRRRAVYAAVGLVTVVSTTLGVRGLTPAAPSVDRATIVIDRVKRGSMVREVRGLGTLVPENIRWIPATTTGRVERIRLRPGTVVSEDTIILELSNPALEQELHEARLQQQAAEAGLAGLRVQLTSEALQQEAAAATIEADYQKATVQVEANEQLAAGQLIAAVTLRQSKLDAEQMARRFAIASKQLAIHAEATVARLAAQQSTVEQARARVALIKRQVDDLTVHAGATGVVQVVPVDVGQHVEPGTNLARVADPSRLKAALKIAETQAKDVQTGQRASIDTRNGLVPGTVTRVDPSVQNGTVTVEVALDGVLPPGSRPDLSVDGTIEIERLDEVLYVGRPAFGRDRSRVNVFKLDAGGATRTTVNLGRGSVNTVEILDGLGVGDEVILSDMSAWDAFDTVRLR
jgi:HlyD family secretion protein